MKMNNLIGVGLLVYCVSMLTYSYNIAGFSPNIKFILQSTISGIGGLLLLLYENRKALLSLFSESHDTNEIDNKKASRLQDVQALSYLRKRVKGAGSAKGLEILIELNSILFVADLGEDDE